MGSQVERTHGKAVAGGPGQARWQLADWEVPHSCADKLGGTTWEQGRPCNPGFQYGEIKLQSLWLKTPVGVEAAARETPLTGQFFGETRRALEPTPTQVSAPRRAQFICGQQGKGLKTGRGQSKWHCSFLDPSPTYSTTTQQLGLPHPGEHLRLHPLHRNRCAKAKKNMALIKEQVKAPKIELNNEGIANLADAQFKTLVIRLPTEMVEYGHKMEEKMKAM